MAIVILNSVRLGYLKLPPELLKTERLEETKISLLSIEISIITFGVANLRNDIFNVTVRSFQPLAFSFL